MLGSRFIRVKVASHFSGGLGVGVGDWRKRKQLIVVSRCIKGVTKEGSEAAALLLSCCRLLFLAKVKFCRKKLQKKKIAENLLQPY